MSYNFYDYHMKMLLLRTEIDKFQKKKCIIRSPMVLSLTLPGN